MSEEAHLAQDRADAVEDAERPAPARGFAELLVQARERAGLPRDAVQQQLNLSQRIVAALEQGDVANLPEPAFVKGYLRAYAKVVEADPEPILAAYQSEGIHDPSLQPVTPQTPHAHGGNLFVRLVGVLLLLAVVGLSMAWWFENNKPIVGEGEQAVANAASDPLDADVPRQVSEHLSESGRDIGEPEAPVANATEPSAVAAVPSPVEAPAVTPEVVVSDVIAESPEDNNTASETPQVVQAVEPEPETPSSTELASVEASPDSGELATPEPQESSSAASSLGEALTQSSADILVLSSTQESWVEIRDANGKRLMFGMLNADKTRRLEGSAPFKVFLGNAPVVKMVINEREVSTPKFSKTKRTARFFLEASGRTRQ